MKAAAGPDVVIGWSTTASVEEAERLAGQLIDENRAACVQVDPSVRSFYRWKGEVSSEPETRLWIKTTRAEAEKMEDFFEKNHPYETPQWIWVSADGCGSGYADWIFESMAK